MKRYVVIKLEEHGENRYFESDLITPCVKEIHNCLDNSKQSWNVFFKHNPMCITDIHRDMVIWSTKSHKNV